jgi:saccharopine dehydrogenase-like NADP-dependent oxidoreductase
MRGVTGTGLSWKSAARVVPFKPAWSAAATGTAISAAAVVRALAEGEVKQPGIWLAEQLVPPGPFFKRLAVRGLAPRIEERPADSPVVPGVSE